LAYSHYQYILKCTEFEGKLKVIDKEGINKWINVSELKKYKLFPDIPEYVEIAMNGNHFSLLEIHIFQDGDVIKGIKVTKKMEI